MKQLSILAEEDDDPMLSAVNLVDVFLVLVVALLTAVALQQQADQTVIKRAGEADMEIVVRKDGKEIRYKGNGGSSEGQGVRAGVAYKLKDGNIIYVPEADKP